MGNTYATKLCCRGSFLHSQFELEIKEKSFHLKEIEDDERLNDLNFEISNIREIPPISGVFDSSYKEFSLDRSRIQRLEKAMYYAKVLNLSVVNPEVSQRSITINALGCENSLREIKDGVTFFGAKKKNAQGQVINDLVFPLVAKNFAKNYRGSHFQISYDVSKDSYFIKDLKVGFGTFYRLSDSIDLKNNTLFHIANSFILASFIDQEQEYSRLQLKVYGKCAGDVFYFNASDYSENYITIGRQENCEVRLQGNLVSKIHCTVFYTPEKGWILSDGDMKNYSNSTNGVWVYINEPVELAHSMLFKSGRIVFQVSIL